MFTVKLETVPIMKRWACLVCGGYTDKDYVQARVYEHGERTGFVVCRACLALSPADRVAQLHHHARQTMERAALMDAVADEFQTMPSEAEWAAANKAVDDEIVQYHLRADEEAAQGRNDSSALDEGPF